MKSADFFSGRPAYTAQGISVSKLCRTGPSNTSWTADPKGLPLQQYRTARDNHAIRTGRTSPLVNHNMRIARYHTKHCKILTNRTAEFLCVSLPRRRPMSAQAMMSASNITTHPFQFEVKTKKHQWLSISRLFVYGYPAEGAGKRGDARGRHRRSAATHTYLPATVIRLCFS